MEVRKKIIGKERKGEERKAIQKKSQKWYISRIRGDGISVAIVMKFGTSVLMVNVINSAKFDYSTLIGLD